MQNVDHDLMLEEFVSQSVMEIEAQAKAKLYEVFEKQDVPIQQFSLYFKRIDECRTQHLKGIHKALHTTLPYAIRRMNLELLLTSYKTSLNTAVDLTVRHGQHQVLQPETDSATALYRQIQLFLEAGRSIIEALFPILYHWRANTPDQPLKQSQVSGDVDTSVFASKEVRPGDQKDNEQQI